MSVKELKAAIRDAGLANKAVGLCEKKEFVTLLTEHKKEMAKRPKPKHPDEIMRYLFD